VLRLLFSWFFAASNAALLAVVTRAVSTGGSDPLDSPAPRCSRQLKAVGICQEID
jgi:hypothetical protein